MRQPHHSVLASSVGVVLTAVLVVSPAMVATGATRYWRNNAGSGNWSDAAKWSSVSAADVNPANNGVPFPNEPVNIVSTDGTARTVTYNVAAPSLGLLSIDLTGPGAAANMLSLPSNFNLTANGIYVGGYSGVGPTAGRGALAQSAGTVTTNPGWDLVVGHGAGSTGTYTLSGGALVANQSEFIGFSGTGTFNHTGGTNTINASAAGAFDLGGASGATGTYNLSGSGTLVSNKSEYIGDSGTGIFNQSGGSNFIAGLQSLYVGNSAGSVGTYTLSAGSLSFGPGNGLTGEYIGHSGSGTFNQSGGANTTEQLILATNSTATGTYNLSGGNLTVRYFFVGTGGTGIFNQTGGTNVVQAGGSLFLGWSSPGTYNLSNGSLTTFFEDLGESSTANFNHTGGTNNVSNLRVGSGSTGNGTYSLSGTGTLSASGTVHVGYDGTGTFNQTGGDLHTSGSLIVGSRNTGAYSLSAGSATVDQTLRVGTVSQAAVGTLNVGGTGVLSVAGTFKIENVLGTSATLSGGTINAGALDFGGVPALFNWTGGKINLTNNVAWDSAAGANTTAAAFGSSLTVSAGRHLTVTGNETLGGAGAFALLLNSGGIHEVTGALTIAASGTLTQNVGSTLTVPTITQAGGTVNGTLQNQTTFTYQSGTFNGRLINHGTFSFGANFTAGNGIENRALITMATGKTLIANGAGFDNQGELVVDGSVAASTFTNSNVLRGNGLVTAALTNATSGDVRVAAGEKLRFAGATFTNQGLVEAIGNSGNTAEMEFNSPVTNATASALIAGSNSLYRFNGGLTNQASFAISIGTSNVFGDITNSAAGTIVVSGGGGATFYDDIVQNGTFRVSKVGSTTSVAVIFGAFTGPGGTTGGGDIFFEGDLRPGNSPASVTFGNNVAIGGGASINIELGGTTPGTHYDQVHVTGQLVLDGVLKVSLLTFNPLSGQSFDILDWGSLSGTFATLDLPSLAPGLSWNTSQLYTAGILSVGQPGDFNANGVVDTTDYVMWRKRNGSQTEYDVWRSHFGQPPGSGVGASTNAAVPEPNMLLLALAASGWCITRSRSHRKFHLLINA